MRTYCIAQGFPGGSVVKNPPANAGDARDMGSIPGLERSPISHGQKSLAGYSPWGRTQMSNRVHTPMPPTPHTHPAHTQGPSHHTHTHRALSFAWLCLSASVSADPHPQAHPTRTHPCGPHAPSWHLYTTNPHHTRTTPPPPQHTHTATHTTHALPPEHATTPHTASPSPPNTQTPGPHHTHTHTHTSLTYQFSSVAQSCPTLCDPMECRPPGSSIQGIFQARILERVAMPSSRGSF